MYSQEKFGDIKSIQQQQSFNLFDSANCLETQFNDFQLLPTQIAYKVDCRCADLTEVKGNLKGLFNIEKLESIDHIYELVRPNHVEKFISETKTNFTFIMAQPQRTEPMRNVFSSIYQMKKTGIGYRPFLRQTFTLRSDNNGIITHTGGIYTQMPELPNLQLHSMDTYQINGEDAIYYQNEHLLEFEPYLSRRELEVLKYISEGYKASEIADTLYISKYTVDTHRKNMIEKLEAKNTTHLVSICKDIGLV